MKKLTKKERKQRDKLRRATARAIYEIKSDPYNMLAPKLYDRVVQFGISELLHYEDPEMQAKVKAIVARNQRS